VLTLSLVPSLVSLPRVCANPPNAPSEYRAKANFLSRVPSFIDWPEESFPAASSPLWLCVYGDFPFGSSLAETTRGQTVRGRKLELHWMEREDDLKGCHIVFLSRSETKQYSRILETLRGKSVLTVGETPDFLDAGGAVWLDYEQETLRFNINLAAAKEARLKISAQLLALAHRVVAPARTAGN
jgi:hypothetical protein